jgi:hypothetical protein
MQQFFVNFVIDNGLSQFVCQPTREKNILDIILSNDNHAVFNVQYHPPFSTSDHLCVSWNAWFPDVPPVTCDSLDTAYNFARADYNQLHTYLSNINWVNMFSTCHPLDTESLWSIFKQVLFDAFSVCVPVHTHGNSRKRKYPKYVRAALNKKKALWHKRFSAFGKTAYKAQALQCDKLIRRHHAAIERKIINSNSVSGFFNYVGGKLNSSHKVAPLQANDGSLLLSDADKAEALNTYFASVFTKNGSTCNSLPVCNAPVSRDVNFSILSVLAALRTSKHTFSAGPDNIPSIFWSKLSSALVFPVSVIFVSSYHSSHLPSDWKHAIVVPIFKKGDASLTKNYRPISLTCTLCKIMEGMIKDNMLLHLQSNNLLDPSQHGFLPSHSTSSQLLECFSDWCCANDQRLPVDAIYIDFSKAFDSVSHSKLISKLRSYNFSDRTVNWLSSFLSNRTQVVKCNKSMSSPVSVTSGVPQGSVCGPLLFILYVNDLPAVCSPCTIKLYADDVKLYFTIKQPSDRTVLQNCLDKVADWAYKWDLLFSYDKCTYLQIGYSEPCITYHLGNHNVKLCDFVNDLGVTVHSSLMSSSHCVSIASKANTRAKLILKCFLSRKQSNFIRAFKVYVRPLLEYASVVWNPWLLKDINVIENVQRRFTRNVCVLCNLPVLSYDERLSMFNLDRLEVRRLRSDLVELFKIVNGYSSCRIYNDLNFACNNNSTVTRGHRFKLNVTRVNKNLFKNYFTNRIVNVWNYLPDCIFSTKLITTFKRNVCRIDLSHFIRGQQ